MTISEARRTFSDLMTRARAGRLTERDRRQLSVARQQLRSTRRPAMNAKKKRTIPELWKRAERLYQQYKTETREYEEIARELGLANAQELNSRISRLRSERLKQSNPPAGERFPATSTKIKCSACHGTGLSAHYGSLCAVCHGSGKVRRNPHRRRRNPGYYIHSKGVLGKKRKRPHKRNPRGGSIQRIGRALEVRYQRTIGREPGYYKHEVESRRAGVYTIPAGWVYVKDRSILITEGEPKQ